MASLRLVSGQGTGQAWKMTASSLLIGRDSRRCDVVLAATSVSRIHAEVSRYEDEFVIVDRGSRAGTWLNGQRLAPQRRYPLDTSNAIEICEYVLLFTSDSPPKTNSVDGETGSVTRWISQLQQDSAEAAQEQLWNRYFSRLVELARYRLGHSPRGAEDEEDAAIRSLACFFDRAQKGQFPELKDRHGLWLLLSKITVRQAINQRKKLSAHKRGGGKVRTESAWSKPGDEFGQLGGLAEVPSEEPTPEFLAQMVEQCTKLMSLLPEELQEIARFKLEGYTNDEIAEKLGKVARTVERKLQQIRQLWSTVQD
jgi:DNA-directed RNA polymerase specialized sigma24 family protein